MTEFRPILPEHDAAMARIVREALKAHRLDIPGTAYFDASLDRLSAYYDRPGRCYHVLLQDGAVVGGVGLAEFDGLPDCCELQKLYLREDARGRGLGYGMIRHIEAQVLIGLGYFDDDGMAPAQRTSTEDAGIGPFNSFHGHDGFVLYDYRLSYIHAAHGFGRDKAKADIIRFFLRRRPFR